MSCKAALYAANTTAQDVAANGVINLGEIIRRFGNSQCCCPIINLSGAQIVLNEAGYYDVDVSVTLAPEEAGTVTVALYQDGGAVPGAEGSVTVTVAGRSVNIAFPALVRRLCGTCCSNLTLVLSGVAADVTNVAVTVERV